MAKEISCLRLALDVKAMAEIKKTNVETVAEQIIKNFESFFTVRLN